MTVTRRQLLVALTGLLGATALGRQPVLAASGPEAYVSQVADGVLAAANSGSVAGFRALLRRNADIPSIALFSLGPYRKNLPSAKRQEYYRLVEQNISSVFAAHSGKLRGQSLSVSGARDAGSSIIVNSRLESPGGRSVPVIWRLVKRGGGYKIFDINVDGVWLANTQRTNFTSVLQKNSGNIDALFKYLRQ